MVSFIFTLDYEIYGNGCGSLRELVLDPTERLAEVFQRHQAPIVVFAEAVELAKIKEAQSDPAIAGVEEQLRLLRAAGHEIALHLHPQWSRAQFRNGFWELDYSEYNLCVLHVDRIARIVDDAIGYLCAALGEARFSPLSFRAGNWLFQPTQHAAAVLASRGLKVDSSVFKGGLQRRHRLDYRRALTNGWAWRFANDVNVPDARGPLLELPIYTQMVPFWKMLTRKRLRLQKKTYEARTGISRESLTASRSSFLSQLLEYCRVRYPLKLDFCRMTLAELTRMVEAVLQEDRRDPEVIKPIVSIGHSKDLLDFETITAFLDWLSERSILVTTFSRLLADTHKLPLCSQTDYGSHVIL